MTIVALSLVLEIIIIGSSHGRVVAIVAVVVVVTVVVVAVIVVVTTIG